MKKMRKIITLCVVLALILTISACAPAESADNDNTSDNYLTVESIQYDPASYLGVISLTGIVGNSTSQDFALLTEAGDFEILVNYRGSQALPEVGDIITVHGRLTQNRPCCGPGFTLTSTRFE